MEFLRDLVKAKNEFDGDRAASSTFPRLPSPLDGAFYGGLPKRFEEMQKDSFQGLSKNRIASFHDPRGM